ncbi:MAG: hypothetical protein U0235_21810 [Polyangiaceae bacterium]
MASTPQHFTPPVLISARAGDLVLNVVKPVIPGTSWASAIVGAVYVCSARLGQRPGVPVLVLAQPL